MKKSNYLYIRRKISERQAKGFHDWDDDLYIINSLIEEYSTSYEDFIMSVYRRTIRNWDEVIDDEPEDRRPFYKTEESYEQ